MRHSIIFATFLSVVSLCWSCKEDLHHPYGTDDIAPGKVTITGVINIAGGAIINYTPPTDVDLLCVKAIFKDNRGIEREVKTSGVINSLKVEGFGETGEYNVSVYAVDRGENSSEAVVVPISPLEPAINQIFPSIQGTVDYGGIKVSYENDLRAEVSLNVAVYDSAQEKMVYRESFFTSQQAGSYSFRGYNSVKTLFGIYVEDRWGNLSDTLLVEVIPIPDEFLDKSRFSIFKINGDMDFGQYGFSPSQMWNNVWNSQWDCGHTAAAALPHRLTINLGTTAKLSRFKLYQRAGTELYKHGNPKHFKVYGTLDVNQLPPFDPANPNAGWTLLKECHSFKPSGLPLGQVSAEDVEFQNKGEDFEFDIENLVEVKYVRIEILENWEGIPYSVIGELSFWGEITNDEL